ncbi:rhodanese-like domain-containing protein [Leptospira sp. WS58.C1]|uniref:rhodanese-like domain-containing protein n=1 Tax=Leptospira TaxID=171 RepID=UPI0002BDBE91|nr:MULTISPECIES: rhodanese-like domain-containing protein [unclassified Leptospira]EMK00898.1 rhodanese-like protein [Leptospira sp. B5-022]MCR1795036.1 rhodanese-like domain-containing protein [Leptospira sp. id769339]
MFRTFYILLIITLFSFSSCKNKEDRELVEWVEKGALVLDVRTPDEYEKRHFPGAVNIPIDSLPLRSDELGPKDRQIILYCQSGGGRSQRAKSLLEEKGFSHIRNAGGIDHLFSVISSE